MSRLVRLWHKADVQTALMNVRFEGNNGHDADVKRCLLMTQSGENLPNIRGDQEVRSIVPLFTALQCWKGFPT